MIHYIEDPCLCPCRRTLFKPQLFGNPVSRVKPDAKDAVNPITKALDDPDVKVGYGAAFALGRIGPAAIAAVPKLLEKLDEYVKAHQYQSRSHAIRDLVRRALVEQEWDAGKEAVAAVVLLFDHHSREISERLREAQHEAEADVLSTLHHHLGHERCLEIITLCGQRAAILKTADRLRGTRGVLHSGLVVSSTGKSLP